MCCPYSAGLERTWAWVGHISRVVAPLPPADTNAGAEDHHVPVHVHFCHDRDGGAEDLLLLDELERP